MSGFMKEGRWFPGADWANDDSGDFVRDPTAFRDRIDPVDATPGRYRLYASYACPWAHRVLISLAIKRVGDALPVTIVDPFMGEEGWAFRDDDMNPADEPEIGARFLREIYLAADSHYSGRVTVPVLWDREQQTIVNNESREILNMLDVELATLDNGTNLYPEHLRSTIDETIDQLYDPINNGVYRCGFASTQEAYQRAYRKLFVALESWDAVLANQSFICGDELTEADICLFTTLIRFDAVYYSHFKCNQRRIADFPGLRGFVRRMYQLPGVAETCRFDHIKNHYYRSHPKLNPSRIVPDGPRLDYLRAPE